MPYSDLHCHPFLRPYQQNNPGSQDPMPPDPADNRSVWYTATEGRMAAEIEELFGFIGYSESDFGNVSINNGAILIASLYAVESGFFQLKKDTVIDKILSFLHIERQSADLLGNWISKFRADKIDSFENPAYDYFNDLLSQFSYASTQAAFSPNPATPALNSKSYSLVNPGDYVKTGPNDIKIIFSIEGGNCLWHNYTADGQVWNGQNFDAKTIWNGRDFSEKFTNDQLLAYKPLDTPDFRQQITPQLITDPARSIKELIPWAVCNSMLQNITALKDHPNRPFFITLGHHFYNGICGHAKSLQPLSDKNLVDQDLGMNSDITNLGWMIINEMLRDDSKRILIDAKHMSRNARLSYYAFRQNNYPDVPIIFSHGAVYGGHFENDNIVDSTDPFSNNFYKQDINLFDDDIANIVNSGGIIGLEIDQRINGVKGSGKNTGMIWHNMRYIAEQASNLGLAAGQSAWDFISLGTDYDGIINPTPGFGTARDMYSLKTLVFNFLDPYLKTDAGKLTNSQNLQTSVIMDKIFYKNIMDFANKHYK